MTAAGLASCRPGSGQLSLRNVPMILMYHGIADVPQDPNQLCVSPSRFAAQLAWMHRHGLRGVGVGTLLDAMRTGRQRGLVGITFDDGYANVLDAALPELRRRGFGATAFIIADRLGGTNEWDPGPAWPLLDADGVRELAAAGIEIGSHSATHARLAGLSPRVLAAEVAASKASLSALVGTEIRGFAYPYGSMDAAARHSVRAAGYAYACAVQAPSADIGLMALPRVYASQRDGACRMAVKRLLYRSYIAVSGMRA
jgi:peptidoglycan/xylan/chitin deacetylase (PgdA/CDA1 family)